MDLLNNIKSKLIVSCQPVVGGVLDNESSILALAEASVNGGATALRINDKKYYQADLSKEELVMFQMIANVLDPEIENLGKQIENTGKLLATREDHKARLLDSLTLSLEESKTEVINASEVKIEDAEIVTETKQ